VRKALLILGVLAVLAVPAAATAAKAPPPPVICGTPCDGGGGGWSGCTTQTETDSLGIRWISYFRHYLVVSYCKSNGIITSISLAAHGCDFEGATVCHAGAAWPTGGGLGYGYATFTGHAIYVGTLAGVPIAGTSVVNLTVGWG
jgi:hypothetical protein